MAAGAATHRGICGGGGGGGNWGLPCASPCWQQLTGSYPQSLPTSRTQTSMRTLPVRAPTSAHIPLPGLTAAALLSALRCAALCLPQAATYAGFAPPPENLPRPPALKRAPSAAPGPSQAAQAGEAAPAPEPNYVQVKLSSLQLACPAADCFVVIKCGPHWGRTEAVRAVAPGVYAFDWEVRGS